MKEDDLDTHKHTYKRLFMSVVYVLFEVIVGLHNFPVNAINAPNTS